MPDSMTHSMNILELLDGAAFPATKLELVAFAEDNGASEEALEQIQSMPGDTYQSIADVNRHINLLDKLPGDSNMWSSEESHDLPDDNEIKATNLRGQGRI